MNTETRNNGYPTLDCPDGQYPVRIVKFDVGNAKNTHRPRLWMLLEILGGPCQGDKHPKVSMLDDVQCREYLRKELEAIGIKTGSPKELEQQKGRLMNMTILAEFKNDGPYLNATFVGTVGDNPEPKDEPTSGTTSIDAITW